MSIGRGTDKPFEVVGVPIDDSKPRKTVIPPKGWYVFTPKSIPGVSDHPKYEGVTFKGLLLTSFANDFLVPSKRIYLELLSTMYLNNDVDLNGEYFKPFFTKLAGGPALQKQIGVRVSHEDIFKSWQPGLDAVNITRSKYLLY